MNQLLLSLRKKLFKIIYLAIESNTSLTLDLTIKQAKFKYNNLFMNKLINMRLNLSIYMFLKKIKNLSIYIRRKSGAYKSQQYLILLFLNS